MRKLALSPEVDLQLLASMLPDNITGADISGITSNAYFIALNRKLYALKEEALNKNSQKGIRKTSTTAANSSTDKHEDTKSNLNISFKDKEEVVAVSLFVNALSDEDLTVVVSQNDFLSAFSK